MCESAHSHIFMCKRFIYNNAANCNVVGWVQCLFRFAAALRTNKTGHGDTSDSHNATRFILNKSSTFRVYHFVFYIFFSLLLQCEHNELAVVPMHMHTETSHGYEPDIRYCCIVKMCLVALILSGIL